MEGYVCRKTEPRGMLLTEGTEIFDGHKLVWFGGLLDMCLCDRFDGLCCAIGWYFVRFKGCYVEWRVYAVWL